MSNVDPVAVAKRWLDNYRRAHVADGGVTVDVNEAVALARVVLAASEFVAATDAANTAALGHDAIGPHWAKRNAAYDALATALKGE